MSKKTFKDNTANIDKFFSVRDFEPQKQRDLLSVIDMQGTSDTRDTQNTTDINDTSCVQDTNKSSSAYYRINLKLNPGFKDYLKQASWEQKMSITEYINELIKTDMSSRLKQTGI